MVKREELKVEKRAVVGKKVKKLRREGILPGNIYGKEFKSTSVQVPVKDFLKVFSEVHETGLVDLAFDSQAIPVLIHNVQIDPRTQTPVHADFFKVNLKEKITARVPIVAVGEAKAVIDKIGLLEQPVGELEIEALPTDLPENIEVNVENLAQVDEQIVVSDIKAADGVSILNEPSQVVFKIGELVTKEMEEEIAAAEAEAAAAAAEAKAEEGVAPAEGVEGEAPAEGEAPVETPAQEAAPAAGEAKPVASAPPGRGSGEPKEEKPAEAEAPKK
ncbi:MAG: 50S ribosomal protein L25 [Candidatus Levybacteria bacterium]|nr:50S ribosomal protein L25 [Candidatus Levybacteria bacterium]